MPYCLTFKKLTAPSELNASLLAYLLVDEPAPILYICHSRLAKLLFHGANFISSCIGQRVSVLCSNSLLLSTDSKGQMRTEHFDEKAKFKYQSKPLMTLSNLFVEKSENNCANMLKCVKVCSCYIDRHMLKL